MPNELKPYDYQAEYYANYEVWLRDKRTGNRRSIILWAENFGEAEKIVTDDTLTRKYFDVGNEEIIRIDREYEVDTHDVEARMKVVDDLAQAQEQGNDPAF